MNNHPWFNSTINNSVNGKLFISVFFCPLKLLEDLKCTNYYMLIFIKFRNDWIFKVILFEKTKVAV